MLQIFFSVLLQERNTFTQGSLYIYISLYSQVLRRERNQEQKGIPRVKMTFKVRGMSEKKTKCDANLHSTKEK